MRTAFRVLLITTLVILQPAAWAKEPSFAFPQGVTANELPRFMQVAEGIFRGGQPNNGGFNALQKMGIRTVINFCGKNEEKELVEKLGMKSVHLPLSALAGIPDGAVRQFFEILRNPNNYPIFFHCRRGADRTGAMTAFYRMQFQGWESRKAAQEARDNGMRWWYRKLKAQIESFDPRRYPLPSLTE